MRNHIIKSTLLASMVLLVGCACSNNTQQANYNDSFKNCPQQRTAICTKEYAPACGLLNNGQLKTYPNRCTACADTNVDAQRPGSCP